MRAPHFLWLVVALAASLPVQGSAQEPSPVPDAKPIPLVQVTPLPDYQASFTFRGHELTRFRFDPAAKRPFWYPAQTSLAPSVIRMGHPHDAHGHRHHYGIWITHNAVSGVNFWADEHGKGNGSIRHQKVLGCWDGDESAMMMTLNHWVNEEDGKVLLIEKRHMEIRPAPDASSWLLIVDSEFLAPKGQTTTLEGSGFGLMSARMAKSIGVHDGGGRILNSEGQVNEEQIFRKPARWCDYSGRLTADGFAGITLMNHPGNPNHPTAYHVRNDGWMCNALSLEKPVAVGDASPLHVRHGLWVHEGVPDQRRCESMWADFVKLPLPDMAKKP
ncbi:PmoA family protein [Verrucomicrobium sp. BvORR034]|uniref:DUF6807 domain-containing protein n=1 Tax=Verrucomicrobium sp. BvORR034 TaxID=1396418 RepID=UPI000679D546|nr:PmoA family protein [Verrucomicrobium sp. BvORR034]